MRRLFHQQTVSIIEYNCNYGILDFSCDRGWNDSKQATERQGESCSSLGEPQPTAVGWWMLMLQWSILTLTCSMLLHKWQPAWCTVVIMHAVACPICWHRGNWQHIINCPQDIFFWLLIFMNPRIWPDCLLMWYWHPKARVIYCKNLGLCWSPVPTVLLSASRSIVRYNLVIVNSQEDEPCGALCTL